MSASPIWHFLQSEKYKTQMCGFLSEADPDLIHFHIFKYVVLKTGLMILASGNAIINNGKQNQAIHWWDIK